VLCNNAGYGSMAAIEEGGEDEVRAMLEANFWGPLHLIRAILPEMRARRRGTAFYSASKHAMEGMSEGLVKEVKKFGIRVTAVEPGPFRTEWAGGSLK